MLATFNKASSMGGRRPVEGKKPKKQEDVGVEKLVSRSLAMRPRDRTLARGSKQDSDKMLLENREAVNVSVSQPEREDGRVH